MNSVQTSMNGMTPLMTLEEIKALLYLSVRGKSNVDTNEGQEINKSVSNKQTNTGYNEKGTINILI
ncbi:MAG: hypothetical protein OEZ22_00820 [Spirochaetia bacterium]|nr:hypothetical protein [Spirochaetia bacterium]